MDWQDTYYRLSINREDVAAWSALEKRIHVWAQTALRSRGWDVVEDAVADTCAAVALSLDRARGPDTFAGFVYGQFLTVRRRLILAHRRREVSWLAGMDPAAPDEDEGLPTTAQLARLHRALAELPVREHRAVVLRYLECAQIAQIAAELGVTEVNARQLVYRGLKQLRQSLRDPLNTPQLRLREEVAC